MIEKDFVNKIRGKLKKENSKSYCIETGTTTVGFPDLFVMTGLDDYLIEVKITHKKLSAEMVIPWRPGQQAWMLEYYLRHKRCKCAWTFVMTEDKQYIFIPMIKIYNDNKISLGDPNIYTKGHKEWKASSLSKFLDEKNFYIKL